jgi:DtxR family Mn-dependent transcriptional regulator
MAAREVSNQQRPRGKSALSPSQEDYLKQIFLLGDGFESVSTNDLSLRLGVRPASVTGMIQRLADQELVRHEPYHGVHLTKDGRRVALKMLRHHRLLETFLERVLGFGWDEVHDEAERLEHVISEHLGDRIAEAMGHPTHDPHGDPIPDADLQLPPARGEIRLTAMEPGRAGTLMRVGTQDKQSLNRLGRLGLVLGVEIVMVGDIDDEIEIDLNDSHHRLPQKLAGELWLREKK